MNKLISCTDFNLEVIKWIRENNKTEKDKAFTNSVALDRIENYANFLKQPLQLGFFVPVDLDGNVLSELDMRSTMWEVEQYQQAKERVLFEGFYIHHGWVYYPNQVELVDNEFKFLSFHTVEWLLNNSYQDLTLTPTAIKQIFG